jgi:hypothetical protein
MDDSTIGLSYPSVTPDYRELRVPQELLEREHISAITKISKQKSSREIPREDYSGRYRARTYDLTDVNRVL